MALSDWRRIEVYHEGIAWHKAVRVEVDTLCCQIAKLLGSDAGTPSTASMSGTTAWYYGDASITIEAELVGAYNNKTTNLTVTWLPRQTVVYRVSYVPTDFRVGTWIDHIASLQPKAEQAQQKQEDLLRQQATERNEAKASAFSRLD